jgi:hypothetical protein
MLFSIQIVTVDHVTIERDSLQEAQEYAKALEQDFNRDHHHGEKTTAKATPVVQS